MVRKESCELRSATGISPSLFMPLVRKLQSSTLHCSLPPQVEAPLPSNPLPAIASCRRCCVSLGRANRETSLSVSQALESIRSVRARPVTCYFR